MFAMLFFTVIILMCTFGVCFSIDFSSVAPGDSLFFKSRIEGEIINANSSSWEKIIPLSSEPQCRSKCHHSTQCRSAAFYPTDNICKFRDVNRLSPNGVFVQKAGIKVYDKRTAPITPVIIKTVENATDCKDVMNQGHKRSGVYMVSTDVQKYVPILCDMDTAGGGWTVIQQRVDGSIPFNRTWNSYKFGFGDFSTNFWFGNDRIHNLTTHYGNDNDIIFDLTKHDGTKTNAGYRNFYIDGESDKYRLHVNSRYDPDLPDSSYADVTFTQGFGLHDGKIFYTIDADSSLSCSEEKGGSGWWFANCYKIHLNGIYGLQGSDAGIVWDKVTFIVPSSGGNKVQHPFIKTRMLVRRNN
eukprot:TCONS_00008901-protein